MQHLGLAPVHRPDLTVQQCGMYGRGVTGYTQGCTGCTYTTMVYPAYTTQGSLPAVYTPPRVASLLYTTLGITWYIHHPWVYPGLYSTVRHTLGYTPPWDIPWLYTTVRVTDGHIHHR